MSLAQAVTKLKFLYERLKRITTIYLGVFVVTMVLNQALLFGFCLDLYCLAAALPHVSIISIVIGTWLNKKYNWGNSHSSLSSKGIEYKQKLHRHLDHLERLMDEKEQITRDKSTARDQQGPIVTAAKVQHRAYTPVKPASNEHKAHRIVSPEQTFRRYGINSLWHISHRDNLSSILENGILSHNMAHNIGQKRIVDISDSSVQRWRKRSEPCYGRPIHDYVPLYMKCRNPMLFRLKDRNESLCLIEVSLSVLKNSEILFTDGNAASAKTSFYSTADELRYLSWDILNSEYWSEFEDGKRIMCSELLIYSKIEPSHIKRICCYSDDTARFLHASMERHNVIINVLPDLFF
jgi:hypothetical protein